MNIENVLKKFREHYLSIFEAIYPSKNSTGFTERNLSVNFAKSYEYFNPVQSLGMNFNLERRTTCIMIVSL